MSVMESQKAAEDRQNKETPTDSRGFIVPQTQTAFFPGSRNVRVIRNL